VTSTVPLCSEAMRIAALYDADDALVSELLAPPPREECRAALEFWQARLAHLPRYRLSARREARLMATRWEARLRAAEEAALPAPVRWLRAGLRAAAGARPAPVRWLHTGPRMLRRALLATVLLFGAWIVTFWLLVIATLVVLFD
jgi:hypothetical protein